MYRRWVDGETSDPRPALEILKSLEYIFKRSGPRLEQCGVWICYYFTAAMLTGNMCRIFQIKIIGSCDSGEQSLPQDSHILEEWLMQLFIAKPSYPSNCVCDPHLMHPFQITNPLPLLLEEIYSFKKSRISQRFSFFTVEVCSKTYNKLITNCQNHIIK